MIQIRGRGGLSARGLLLAPDELIVDSFAGGGGASLGIFLGVGRHPDIAINHDAWALAMHRANHPNTTHFTENIWAVDPTAVTRGRRVGLLWLSPDCTHHARAKGGMPLSNKRRGLAWVAVRWAANSATKPRVIVLENVREFEDWHVVCRKTGRPVPAKKGRTFRAFVRKLERMGYVVDWRVLTMDAYGLPTIRERLFLVARCDGLPIRWPAPTHGDPRAGYAPPVAFGPLVDSAVPARSIFGRPTPLVPATQRRIVRGLEREVLGASVPYVLRTDTAGRPVLAFLAKHYTERKPTDVNASSLTDPIGTITTTDHHSLVEVHLGTTGSADVAALVAQYGRARDAMGDLSAPAPIVPAGSDSMPVMVTVHGRRYAITDIRTRPLTARELARGQGFPDGYVLEAGIDATGAHVRLSPTRQKGMIGNSVCPLAAAAVVRAQFASPGQWHHGQHAGGAAA